MHWKPLNHLAAAVVALGGLALIVIIATTGWQVFGRYVLNDTPTWAERLSLILILVVSLPIAAIGLREDFHLGISLIVEMLPKRIQRSLQIVNAVILAAFGAAMAYFSWSLVTSTWNRSIPLLGIPQSFQYLPLVICGVLIFIFMIERLVGLIGSSARVRTPGEALLDEAVDAPRQD
ncbi:TRAP transporter small permease [Pararhizobium haloflavum]|uniref:TRAP transporter small permease n=1 Tax=Pararhizobium haloflavum TaxID=2037914 RepID=UPI000C18DA82|nr:TRAP transporter small permease [Pararhizobium haloflavum]